MRRSRLRRLSAWIAAAVYFVPSAIAQLPPPPRESAARAAAQETGAAAEFQASLARFRARVGAALAEAPAQKEYLGVLVADARTGETLYALNPQSYFLPASNAKLFTTALALATLGTEYRFHTTIETRGTIDRYGRLRGDLVLVGRGDPNLSNREFPYDKKVEFEGPPEKVVAELADAVVARGVRQIEGSIVADDSYFAPERYPPGWTIQDITTDYGAPVSAIAIEDNTLEIEVRPGERQGEPAWFGVEPWAAFYDFENDVTTGPADSDLQLKVEREPGSRQVVLRGSIPLHHAPEKLYLAIEEPAGFAADLLKRMLEARGVRVYGHALARHISEAEPGAPLVLAEHVSPPLIEAVRLLNKISQNLHAELLLRAVAREKMGVGTTEAGLQLEQEFLAGLGIAAGDVVLADGSGLSRYDLVTPEAVVRLLSYAARQSWGPAYISTLPVAGEDGTLADRMKATAAAGRIEAKTGALEHVRALSGFATTRRGTHLVFAMFVNNTAQRGRDASTVLDAIATAMVEEIGAPAK